MDRCRQLVLHPPRNVQPVQLVVQEMAESVVVLPRVADDASGSIQYALELVCGGLGPPPQREWSCSGCVVSQTTAGAETRRVHRAGGDARIRGRSMQCPVHHYLARELFSPAADRKLHGPCNCSDKRLPVRHLSSNSYASRTGIELTI